MKKWKTIDGSLFQIHVNKSRVKQKEIPPLPCRVKRGVRLWLEVKWVFTGAEWAQLPALMETNWWRRRWRRRWIKVGLWQVRGKLPLFKGSNLKPGSLWIVWINEERQEKEKTLQFGAICRLVYMWVGAFEYVMSYFLFSLSSYTYLAFLVS